MSTTITPTTAASSLLNTLSGTPATTTVGPQANDPQMNEFLQLLTAQLQNQDPTSPTDPTQFVSQLAQFSTVEQLVQSNTKLDTISQTLSGLALGQYSGLINHTVSAAATSITVPTSDHRCVGQSGAQHTRKRQHRSSCVRRAQRQWAAAAGWPVRRFVGRHDEPGHVTVGRDIDHHRHCVWRVAGFERWLAASVQRRPHGGCVNGHHGVVAISRTAVA